jgi:hypothetical protein
MPDKLIRGFSQEEADELEARAAASGNSFQEWGKRVLLQAVKAPEERYAFKGYGPDGAYIFIRRMSNHLNGVGGSARNLNSNQMDVYKMAQDLIRRNSPGDRERAMGELQKVDFELFDAPVI